jgi:hypothetical protein
LIWHVHGFNNQLEDNFMEPLTIVTVAVGFIGLFHILDSAARVLAKRKGAAVKRGEASNDWYCFFRMSALLGPDWKPFELREREKRNLTDVKRDEQRRTQANRPRLHV